MVIGPCLSQGFEGSKKMENGNSYRLENALGSVSSNGDTEATFSEVKKGKTKNKSYATDSVFGDDTLGDVTSSEEDESELIGMCLNDSKSEKSL